MVRFKQPGYKKLADNVIRRISTTLDSLRINWSLGYGTALSFKQIGDYFDNDRDVDIDIWDVDESKLNTLIDELDKYFPREFIRSYHLNTYLIAYRVNRMRIDIHVWTDGEDGYKYRFDMLKNGSIVCYRIPSSIFKYTTAVFRKIYVKTYLDKTTYLNYLYGDEWNVYKDESEFSVKTDAPCLIPLDECPL